jgi:hypothetical protein
MTRSRVQLLCTTLIASSLTAVACSVAFAQETTQVQPTPPTAPAEAPALTPPAVAEPAAPAPAESSLVVEPPPASIAPPESAPASEVVPPPEAEPETPWYANFKLGGFVDAYAAIRSDKNSRPQFAGVPYGGYFHEAYVQANGFALAVAGLDASYSGDQLGATISLRFGPAVNRFYGTSVSDIGIQYITQAYATYKPIKQLTFDLGQFSTIYGAEVLESWKNVNYSRGALYYAMQPFWHTGLRANFAITDSFALNGLVVNGVNNAFENNKSPSLGLQAVYTAGSLLTVSAGYLGAIHPRSGANGVFQNFFDVVAVLTTGGFKLVANADLNLYRLKGADSENFWGISVAPSYTFHDCFGVGLRFEYLVDSANQWGMTKTKTPIDAMDATNGAVPASKSQLTTLTATLDIKPIPGVTALILRPEFRVEFAGDYYFENRDNELTKTFWTLMLGAVVTSL